MNNRAQSIRVNQDFSIGQNHPPFIIAELSGNHNGSLERALAIADAAADAGAHAFKLQTYTADSITLDCDRPEFMISDEDSLWRGKRLHELYRGASTPWEWHEPIRDRCLQRGMVFFSTPFDVKAIELLESLNAPLYKVASFEIVDLELLQLIGSVRKPVILSTGMSTVSEIEAGINALMKGGATEIILLKCTSAYPAKPEFANLRTIAHMQELFQTPVGFSDHTPGIGASLAAVTLGACVIEKHITLRRAAGGVDSAFSLEPEELEQLVSESHTAWRSIGNVHYGPTPSERSSLRFRRSLYIASDMQAGDSFTRQNLRSVRPGFGLEPRYLPMLLGKRVNRAVKFGEPVRWDMIG
jgi:pseudaminic acid synthase